MLAHIAGFIISFAIMASIFFFTMRTMSRKELRRASKTPGDLPGGEDAFFTSHLVQAVYVGLAISTAIALQRLALDGFSFWNQLLIVVPACALFTLVLRHIANWIMPSIRRVDQAMNEIRRENRKTR